MDRISKMEEYYDLSLYGNTETGKDPEIVYYYFYYYCYYYCYLSYGARYYDPKVSVWLSVDPKADWYPSQSPYNFSQNNPINLVDPNGQWVEGAGFFRNVFNSDEKILAQDLAAEHDGEAFKHGDAWRATWTTPNNANIEGVDLNLDDLHIVDFKKGVKRDGTYDSGQHMADAKLDSWLDDNMRSGLSSWNRVAEYGDQVIAPRIAQTAGNIFSIYAAPLALSNAGFTMYYGEDIFGNEKSSFYDRFIRPGLSLVAPIPGAPNVINQTDQVLNNTVDLYNATTDPWKEKD